MKHTDDERQDYYYNEETKENLWDKPDDDNVEIKPETIKEEEGANATQSNGTKSSAWGGDPADC